MRPSDLLAIFAIGAVLLLLERLAPFHPGQKALRRGWELDLAHIFFSGTLIRFGTFGLTLALSVLAVSGAPAAWREAVRAQPDWLEFIEVLVLSDLAFYAGHRLCHAVPLLWRFHAVHHSSEQLDWLATYRVHPVDQILNASLIAAPAILLGFSPLPVAVYLLVYRIQSPLLHSNLKLNLGPLGHIFTTPAFHHWHHADQAEAYDKNFGGQLSLFDRLFGTAHEPSGKPERYGLSRPIAQTYAGQLLGPFGFKPRRKGPAAAEA